MTPADVRVLARSAHERWVELELVDRSDYVELRATLRHGEVDAIRLDGGHLIHEVGAPASGWSVRPLEPYATNYQWSAMFHPYELGEGVEISDVRSEELFGRPVVAFVAHAVPGSEPVCSCCPRVFSEVSHRLEYGHDWRGQPGELPDGVDLALDLGAGIVVSNRNRGGRRGQWFTNEITRVA